MSVGFPEGRQMGVAVMTTIVEYGAGFRDLRRGREDMGESRTTSGRSRGGSLEGLRPTRPL